MRLTWGLLVLVACGGGGAQTTATTATTATAELPKSPPPPTTYPIHLSHASQVGERAHVVLDQSEDKETKVSKGATVVDDKHERTLTHYDYVATVAAVDDKGHATRMRHEVKELSVNGKPLAKGVVEITRAPKEKDATITVDGAPATPPVREALSALLKLGLGGASDDDIFGTTTPQAVGAHWPIHAELAREDLHDDAGVDAANVSGDVWLAGITRAENTDCLDLHAKLSLEGLSLPNPPPGSVVESGHADAEMAMAMPVDGHHDRVADTMSMKLSIRMRVQPPKGGPAVVTVTLTRAREGHTTPL